jgi:hypothetical protein
MAAARFAGRGINAVFRARFLRVGDGVIAIVVCLFGWNVE